MANEVRLIDANALFYRLVNTDPNTHGRFCDGVAKAMEFILNAPTIDPGSLRPKGRWEPIVDMVWDLDTPVLQGWRCSECGRMEQEKEPYCNCGAKMEEKHER